MRLLRLKIYLRIVIFPLHIWVVPPSWIVRIGVGVVRALIVVDIVGLLILLEGKLVTSLAINVIMTPLLTVTKDKLPNCFPIGLNNV